MPDANEKLAQKLTEKHLEGTSIQGALRDALYQAILSVVLEYDLGEE